MIAAAGVPEVSAVRFGVDGQRTQVILELDRPVSFRTLAVSEPLRLFIELPEVDWQLRHDLSTSPRGLVTLERHGLFSQSRSRLVLDLAAPFRIVRQVLVPPPAGVKPYLLMIDLEPLFPAQPSTPSPPALETAEAERRAIPPIPLPRPRDLPVVIAQVDLPPPVALAAFPPTADPLPPVAPIAVTMPEMREVPPSGAAGSIQGALAVPPDAQPRLERRVVVIDPGHGGVDPGAIGVGGVREKDIVLGLAQTLRDLLERTGRYRVVLTRDNDTFLSLRERLARARAAEGELFISLHADALNFAKQRGASIYTLSEAASDEEAGRFAAKENKSDILATTDLSVHDAVVTSILIDLAQRETNNRSIALAELLADELALVTPLVHRHRRFAGFAVLKSPDIPSALVEFGYLSNPKDAHDLSRPAYRISLAEAVLRALDRFSTQPD
jgi:N-acetylmuramoyl-L-alanine amidase